MATNVKIIVQDAVISYGPQRVTMGQVLTVENDAEAAALIAQGIATVDGVDPVNSAPMTDGGAAINGDPGGAIETIDQIG